MKYAYIICAGKQSRFKSETPKALVNINGETLLEKNIKALTPYCDKIFVVCSYENEHHFLCDNKIVIKSGKGSGDAVWQALNKTDVQQGDSCFILWGDSLQTSRIYETLTNSFDGKSALVPCVFEENPYVQVKQNGKNKLSVGFGKFGEVNSSGFHDLSVFYCEAYELWKSLTNFREKILDKNGNYVHKHGNEMEFLDVFNETSIKASCLEIEAYKDFSFNTVEQLNELVKEDSKNL